jgi:hypothetical protein
MILIFKANHSHADLSIKLCPYDFDLSDATGSRKLRCRSPASDDRRPSAEVEEMRRSFPFNQ